MFLFLIVVKIWIALGLIYWAINFLGMFARGYKFDFEDFVIMAIFGLPFCLFLGPPLVVLRLLS